MLRKELALFDKAAFGVVGINKKGEIGYSNRWIDKQLRTRIKKGTPFRKFVRDPESIKTLEAELKRRFDGRSGQYEITLEAHGQPVKVEMYGTPVRGANGRVTGAIAFVTNASIERLRDSILNVSVSVSHPLDALDKLRVLLEPYFPMDFLAVALYDDGLEHTRVLYFYARESQADPRRWDKHWVGLTKAQRAWIMQANANALAIPDIVEFMEKPPFCDLKDDAMFLQLKQMGARSSGTILVREGKRIVASLTLISKQSATYDQESIEELQRLPIARCILTSMTSIRNLELQFRYRLVRRLARCTSISELARRSASMLRRQHKLCRAGLFSICAEGDGLRPRAESTQEDIPPAAVEAAMAPLRQAILEVGKTGQPVYLPELHFDAATEVEDSHIGSAYVWPVLHKQLDGTQVVRWVFYVIDRRPNAFAPVDRKTFAAYATDVAGLFEWLTELELVGQTVASASDAILVVDSSYRVRRANPAADAMFGTNRDLTSFFADAEVAKRFLTKTCEHGEAVLRDQSGKQFSAIVSCSVLPDSIGGKVFTFEDITQIKRLEDLGFLGHMASELAVQMQTPLTLATSWVQRIGDDPGNRGEVEKLARAALPQLRRIQACLDRIALYISAREFRPHRRIPINLDSELERVVTELPESERKRIRFRPAEGNVRVSADPGHVGFVFDTLLAYFLRDLPSTEKVKVTTGHGESGGWFDCRVTWPVRRNTSEDDEEAEMPLAQELGLVKAGLERILEGYDGKLSVKPSEGRRVSHVRVELPLS